MYRREYPRPEFKREEWMSLNGTWDFSFHGEKERSIEVPFCVSVRNERHP